MRSTTVTRVGVVVAVLVALVFGGAIASAGIGSSGVGGTAESSATEGATTTDEATTYLFALRAVSMHSVRSGSSTSVTLDGVDPQGEWFTDRPVRRSGASDLEQLLPAFFGVKSGSPPNVVLAGMSTGRGFLSVVEFRDPQWDASARRLVFVAEPLSDRSISAIPETASDVSVTVDSVWQSCTIQIAAEEGVLFRVQGSPQGTFGWSPTLVDGYSSWSNQTIEVTQQGSDFHGCGGYIYVDLALPGRPATAAEPGTLETPVGTVSIQWSNPNNGANTISVEGGGPSVSVDLVGNPDPHSDNPTWVFDVNPS